MHKILPLLYDNSRYRTKTVYMLKEKVAYQGLISLLKEFSLIIGSHCYVEGVLNHALPEGIEPWTSPSRGEVLSTTPPPI